MGEISEINEDSQTPRWLRVLERLVEEEVERKKTQSLQITAVSHATSQ